MIPEGASVRIIQPDFFRLFFLPVKLKRIKIPTESRSGGRKGNGDGFRVIPLEKEIFTASENPALSNRWRYPYVVDAAA